MFLYTLFKEVAMKHLVTIFRYIALIGIGFETYSRFIPQLSVEWWLIVILLYAVNFQIRYYNRIQGLVLYFLLLLDIVFIGILYARFNLFSLFALTIFVFDSFYLSQLPLALSQQCLFVLVIVVLSEFYGYHLGILETLYFLMIVLYSYSYAEGNRQAQTMEDENYQLHHQINDLEKNKEVMEQYMGSMRELYTLRERNRLSRELHDSVGHSLSTIIIQLGAISSIAKEKAPEIAEMSEALRDFSSRSMKQVREQLAEMKPELFNRNQLFIAIDEMMVDYRKNTNIDVNFGISEQKWLLSEKQELLLYRIIQEFLSNTAKYAQATRINIFLHFNEEDLILTLKDNGQGAEKVVPHLGLLSVEERIKELKGDVKVNTSPGNGFHMQVAIHKEGKMQYG